MHGLAVFFHHIVGNVNQVVDGTDAAGCQSSLHPFGRRSDFDIFAHSCTVSGAEVGIFNGNLDVVVDIVSCFFYFHNGRYEGLVKGCGSFSGNT